ncbi:MAG: glycosyltransferase, partial [Oscillospiraceae bacterium]|nr:glycosyltransferase [Oscillospiraceae bacterium]
MKRIVLIPAYMPDEKLIEVAHGMFDEGFAVVVVNDGSPEEYDGVFEKVAPYAEIIHHQENRGKGEALKTGFVFIKNHYEPPYTVVSADADGQHKVEDILRVVEVA